MTTTPNLMLPVLPCGIPFDAQKGECCASNCTESSVRAEKDPKLRFLAVAACRYWATSEGKTAGTSKKKTGTKKAGAKSRKK